MAFWRKFIRKKMKPMDPEYARRMRNRISALYFLVAWNIVGFAIYKWTKEALPPKTDEFESSGRYYARTMGMGEGKVYLYKGFDLVEHFDNPPLEEKKPGKQVDNSKNHEKTLPNEDLELLVEESGSL